MVRLRKSAVPNSITFVDLFCGIGGFRFGAENVFKRFDIKHQCVFSCDIDNFAQDSYLANFGEKPFGDISKLPAKSIPDHDLLFAGFPCQPFSIIGLRKGFQDTRGTLFFEIARILKAKRPKAFILENVKQLKNHNKGKTLKKIISSIQELGYYLDFRILNALDFGLPQKRERLFIIGLRDSSYFSWPQGGEKFISLKNLLEKNVPKSFYVSKNIKIKRNAKHRSNINPSIWHENKSGNISSHPFSCALRAGASHNYLLVNGERRLTPREMLRLQGFPDSFKIVCSNGQTKKQTGNAVPVSVVQSLVEALLPNLAAQKHSFQKV